MLKLISPEVTDCFLCPPRCAHHQVSWAPSNSFVSFLPSQLSLAFISQVGSSLALPGTEWASCIRGGVEGLDGVHLTVRYHAPEKAPTRCICATVIPKPPQRNNRWHRHHLTRNINAGHRGSPVEGVVCFVLGSLSSCLALCGSPQTSINARTHLAYCDTGPSPVPI